MVLPYIEVSHLPSSSSFFSSVLQPLGLRYLNNGREKTSSVGTVTYGFPSQGHRGSLPILQIREASRPFEPLKHSFIVLGAASPTTVTHFHECALASNPWQQLQSETDGLPSGYDSKHRLGIEGGVHPSRATVRDLDGNIIQVIPVPPSAQHDAGQVLEWDFDLASRSKHTRTRSQSHPLPSPASSSGSSHSKSQAPFHPQPRSQATIRSSHKSFGSNGAPTPVSQRAPSHVSEEDEPVEEPSLSPRQSANNGLSTTQVVGAILGVASAAAAGAALTYNMVTRDRDRKPRHEMEPPVMSRRSTFPEKSPSVHHRPRHDDRAPAYPGYPPKALPYRTAGPYEQQALPAPQPYTEELPFRQPGYQNDYPRKLMYQEEVTPNKFSFPDDYTPRKMPYDDDDDDSDEPPRCTHSRHAVEYLTEDPLQDSRSTSTRNKARSVARSVARSSAGKSTAARSSAERSTVARSIAERSSAARSTAKSTARSMARSSVMSRIPDEIEETRSRHSSRHSNVSGRSRSEAPAPRGSLFMGDGEYRSHVGSRHSVATKSTYSRARSQRPDHNPERNSYFSARTRRSSAGVRHPPPPAVETEVMAAPEVPEAPEEPIYDDFEDYEHVPRGPGLVIRNRDGSKFSVTRLTSGGEPPIIMSHQSIAPSHISARDVSLPMSGVGSSHADWDDDVISLAPSDSISCVGSRVSRRSRRAR